MPTRASASTACCASSGWSTTRKILVRSLATQPPKVETPSCQML